MPKAVQDLQDQGLNAAATANRNQPGWRFLSTENEKLRRPPARAGLWFTGLCRCAASVSSRPVLPGGLLAFEDTPASALSVEISRHCWLAGFVACDRQRVLLEAVDGVTGQAGVARRTISDDYDAWFRISIVS